MNTCEDHDSVVVYDGRECPVCELKRERDDYQGQRDFLMEDVAAFGTQVGDLEDEIFNLEKKVEDLQRKLLTKELKELEGGKV